MSPNYISEGIKGFSDFTEKELQANREGQLTTDQLERIKVLAKTEKGIMKMVTFGMFLFFLVIFLGIYYFDSSFRQDVGPHALQWVLLVFGIIFLTLLLSYFFGKKMATDFSKVTKVEIAQGKAGKKEQYSDGLRAYTILIQGVKFPATDIFYEQIKEGQEYAFYYVPATNYNLILSWEAI